MGGEMGTEGNGDGPFVSVPLLIHETGGRKQKDRPLSPSSRSLTLATVSHSGSIFDFPEYAKQRRISALVSSFRISRVRREKRASWNMQPDTVP